MKVAAIKTPGGLGNLKIEDRGIRGIVRVFSAAPKTYHQNFTLM